MSKKKHHKKKGAPKVKETTAQNAPQKAPSSVMPWLILSGIILFIAFIRFRLLDFPLERDEGEYAYFGQLILDGIAPYTEAYNMKFPGTYFMYALLMLFFGETIAGVHAGLMVISIISMVLLFLIGKRTANNTTGLIIAATYGILSLSPKVLGFAGHATHFVSLFAIGGTLMLLKALESRKFFPYLWAGVLMSLATIMKQSGVFFALFGAAGILLHHYRKKQIKQSIRPLISYIAGGVIPAVLLLLYLSFTGALQKFWFWTIEYASKYGAQVPFSDATNMFGRNFPIVREGFSLIWLLALAGLIALFFKQNKLKFKAIFTLFFFCAFLSICPGFDFRLHYFITLLPAIAILTGAFVYFVSEKLTSGKLKRFKWVAPSVVILLLIFGINHHKAYFFKTSPVKLSRSIYGTNPFPEAIRIADFIEKNTQKEDQIAVFGSEPQIYFYANRKSATGYIYTYNLMEIHDYVRTMQQEMANEIEAARPKYIVVANIQTSWLRRPDSETYIYEWFGEYSKSYNLAGIVDIISVNQTVYKWGQDAYNYKPRSKTNLHILVRKGNGK